MDYKRIFELILDIGAAMTACGGETRRVNTAVYMLAKSYGFQSCNFWIVPSNVEGTATSPTGETYTEIRHIRGVDTDFGMLDELNALSRRLVSERPDANVFSRDFLRITAKKKTQVWLTYVAGVFAAGGFAGFYGCDFPDILVTAIASLLVTFTMRHLAGRESNPLIKNFIVSLMIEFFILTCVHLGFGHHVGLITISIVMMLVSGLATTNGIHDLVHLDTLSGITNIALSATGAIGIAMGMAVPLYFLRDWAAGEQLAGTVSVPITLVSALIACLGFALWFGVRKRRLITSPLGSVITTGAFLLASSLIKDSSYITNLIAAIICGAYAQIMARAEKAPATIFVTIGALPLIPGSSLYYLMLGIVTRNLDFARSSGMELVRAAFGIVMGLMAVEAAVKFINGAKNKFSKKKG